MLFFLYITRDNSEWSRLMKPHKDKSIFSALNTWRHLLSWNPTCTYNPLINLILLSLLGNLFCWEDDNLRPKFHPRGAPLSKSIIEINEWVNMRDICLLQRPRPLNVDRYWKLWPIKSPWWQLEHTWKANLWKRWQFQWSSQRSPKNLGKW